MMHSPQTPNRLVNEKSPYLLQHSGNPVDWYPWSEKAFGRVKAEDKPIFCLSDTAPAIGAMFSKSTFVTICK